MLTKNFVFSKNTYFFATHAIVLFCGTKRAHFKTTNDFRPTIIFLPKRIISFLKCHPVVSTLSPVFVDFHFVKVFSKSWFLRNWSISASRHFLNLSFRTDAILPYVKSHVRPTLPKNLEIKLVTITLLSATILIRTSGMGNTWNLTMSSPQSILVG